jgi:CBS domain containing-hemolysin-like protein
MTQAIFAVGNRPARQFHLPLNAIVAIRESASYVEFQRVLRRHPVSELLVLNRSSHAALGYVRAIDGHLLADQWPEAVRPLMKIGTQESYISALTQMQSGGEPMAELVDPQGRTVGILLEDRLLEPLFRQR